MPPLEPKRRPIAAGACASDAEIPRTEWKNTGAAKQSGATRSSRPTAPVTDELPRKLRTPASRLSAVITNSPSVPAAPAIAPIASAASGLNGVTQYSSTPTTAAAPAPAPNARHENERLIARATGRRRSRRLATSWPSWAATTTRTRNRTRKAPRSLVARQVEQEQRRRVAHAVDG